MQRKQCTTQVQGSRERICQGGRDSCTHRTCILCRGSQPHGHAPLVHNHFAHTFDHTVSIDKPTFLSCLYVVVYPLGDSCVEAKYRALMASMHACSCRSCPSPQQLERTQISASLRRLAVRPPGGRCWQQHACRSCTVSCACAEAVFWAARRSPRVSIACLNRMWLLEGAIVYGYAFVHKAATPVLDSVVPWKWPHVATCCLYAAACRPCGGGRGGGVGNVAPRARGRVCSEEISWIVFNALSHPLR